MLGNEQLTLLDRLRFGESAAERSQALKDLKLFELEKGWDEDDLIELLNDNDFVFQTYAIGAIGRQKIAKAETRLSELYVNSEDSLLLTALLEAFANIGHKGFVDIVVEKLKKLTLKTKESNAADYQFILDQIVVPSLKYFQIAGDSKAKSSVESFLSDSDINVRWHALITCDRLGLELGEEILNRLKTKDSYALVREQAAIMLDKKKS